MSFDLSTINWLAVIVGGVAYFALGALWFSNVLFARPWSEASAGIRPRRLLRRTRRSMWSRWSPTW